MGWFILFFFKVGGRLRARKPLESTKRFYLNVFLLWHSFCFAFPRREMKRFSLSLLFSRVISTSKENGCCRDLIIWRFFNRQEAREQENKKKKKGKRNEETFDSNVE